MIPINKWEKEVQKSLLDSEEATLKELQKQYDRALRDIGQKVKAFQVDIDMLDAALESDNLDDAARQRLLSQKRSKVYQKQYQEALQGQISGILDQMQGNNFTTIEAYLKQTYEDAYIGTMYDIHKQGIPIITPIDQAAAVKAILTDSKISKGLYTALGMDIAGLKKSISAEITRGIASSLSYADIARNLNNVSKAGYSNAKRIVVTEGHRIQQTSANDARKAAKSKGADVVKQWDAALDGKTRPNHRQLDGQIREVDEPFEVGGMKAMFPGDFGDPAEDCNCRCTADTRARWALDEDELQTLKDRAEYFGLDKTKDFEEYKKKFKIAAKETEDAKPLDITEGGKYLHLTTKDKNEYADAIEHEFSTQQMAVKELNQLWQKDGGYIQNSQGYSDINSYMRGLKPKLDNPKCHLTMNVMKRVTKNNQLQKDYIGFRKVDSGYLENVMGLDISGLFKNSLQKNGQGSLRPALVPKDRGSAKAVVEKIKAVIGTEKGTIKDDGFTSLSLSEGLNYFKHYPIEFKVQMPKGTSGIITDNLDESEFIAKNGSSIEILDAFVYNDGAKECIMILSRMNQ